MKKLNKSLGKFYDLETFALPIDPSREVAITNESMEAESNWKSTAFSAPRASEATSCRKKAALDSASFSRSSSSFVRNLISSARKAHR